MQSPAEKNIRNFATFAVLAGVSRSLALRLGAMSLIDAPSGSGLLVKAKGGDVLVWPFPPEGDAR